ncbi:MAG TPA: sigma-70 family RNA polymerase sigma factor [Pirellulales bacterium]|nr:sigma-70 family RNA polymerase sigma factor [Pirellulales bacterium]
MSETAGPPASTTHWLNLLRAGDPAAAPRLIEHTCERLREIARRMLRRFPQVQRWEQTDDVFCEAVTKLHRALSSVQPENSRHFYNLAATQMRRVLIDFARHYGGAEGLGAHHETAHLNSNENAPPKYDSADSRDEPATLLEWTEFHELVDSLPPEEREIVDLLWYQQLTQEQAAELLGVTTRTIRRRWQDARYKLSKARLGEPLPE